MTDQAERVGDQVGDALTRVFGDATPSSVFSSPEPFGDSVVISAAAWERAGGFGFGAGSGQEESTGDQGGGGGGGGGGSSQVRPVAVIRVSPSGIEVEPVVDFTKIGVTLLLAFVGVWRALKG